MDATLVLPEIASLGEVLPWPGLRVCSSSDWHMYALQDVHATSCVD